jgi:hypothetical protein
MIVQLLAWAGLLAFGFGYNIYVASHIKRKAHDFMARFVMLGIFFIVMVQTAVTGHWGEGALYLIAFACGGLGMAWGSWRRRVH